MPRKNNIIKLTVELTVAEASNLHLWLRRCTFHDFLRHTEPHKGSTVCQEDAYKFRDAAGKIERALETARIA